MAKRNRPPRTPYEPAPYAGTVVHMTPEQEKRQLERNRKAHAINTLRAKLGKGGKSGGGGGKADG